MPRAGWRGDSWFEVEGVRYLVGSAAASSALPSDGRPQDGTQTPFLPPTTRQGKGLRAMSDQEPTPKISQVELPAEDDKELERSTSSLARENNDEEAAADTSGTTTSNDPPTRLDDTCTTVDHHKVCRSAVCLTSRKKREGTRGGVSGELRFVRPAASGSQRTMGGLVRDGEASRLYEGVRGPLDYSPFPWSCPD